MSYFLLIAGFVLLVGGAECFVRGSSAVAKLLKIPSVVIGLTIVAMGTSAPEAAVSISASIVGNNDIAVGNILGSNLFNLLAIVGICALIHGFEVDPAIKKRDLPVSLGITALLLIFLIDGGISLAEGIILIVLMAGYLAWTITDALVKRKKLPAELRETAPAEKTVPNTPKSWILSLLGIALGLAAVIFGGQFVVNGASAIAESLGMSQTLIGLTIVAIGTSLPELVTSIVASCRGDSGLALGNVVGSNIFNILFILGTSATIHPVSGVATSLVDTGILLGATAVFVVAAFALKKFPRWAGAVSVLAYVGYTVFIILR